MSTTTLVARQMEVWQFATTEHAARQARHAATESLRSWGLDHTIEVMELLVSELVTNAWKATADRDDTVAMRLTATPTDLFLEVWDANDATPQRTAADVEAEGGRGLVLVEALTSQWAFYRPRSGGKVVWCCL
ncbi:ATP-binding protein [Pseudofrankia sp. DC12]|uniref:ATP-binding protein n=1 Tax=Pseudofrankia sp. DC12 TaxID=683315 RepID=UPI000695E4EA|nr:ATP-binding protein [Pseudofrankia sp. DC12]